MFTLITGTPGAGKTAYTVWEVIRPMLEATITDTAGVVIKRRVLTNVKGLTLPHEVIDADNLRTWHEWCQPGDVIVFDEVQEVWRPRSLGSTVPPAVAAIETHRHKGVDIVVITQHPGLVDSNVRKLVNQHIHLRRLTNAYAYRYEWDSCSDNVKSTKTCLHSGVWRRPKAVHDLYTSAVAHTKTKSRLPALAYLFPVAVLGFVGIGALAYGRITDRFDTSKVAPGAPGQGQAAPSLLLDDALPPVAARAVVASASVVPASSVQYAQAQAGHVGCIVAADRCGCFDQAGRQVDPDPGLCAGLMVPVGDALAVLPEPRPADLDQHDGEVIAFMRGR